MLAIKIWNYLNGYVIIRIEGLSLERLLNLALNKNIYLWDVKRLNKYQVDVSVHAKALGDLSQLIEMLGCRETILDRNGMPFLLKRIRKRKLFILGFFMFFLFLGLLSSFLWQIDIEGLEQTSQEEVLDYLNANGIHTGKFKRNMPKDEIKKLLINEYDYFSFIEAQYKGIKLIIQIKEEDIAPEKVDKSMPVDIVARNRGVITKIINRKGETKAQVGQIVDVGDLIISGHIQDSNFIHAEGEAWARTRYETSVEDYIVTTSKKETGKIIKQKGIRINNRGIRLSNEIPFENYEEHELEKNLIDFSFFKIDFIKIISYEYREVEIEEVKNDIEFLKKSNEVKASEKLNEMFHESVEILDKEIIHYISDNKLITKVNVEANEDISKKHIIENREE